jgi:Domain of unknown function (DUF4252)
MKTTISTLVLSFPLSSAFAQSDSFSLLKEKFKRQDDVVSFSTSGFFARTILWMAGEHEFTDAVKDIKNIHLITIPKAAFTEAGVSVNGFKKILVKDSFEELANIKEDGDDVTFFLQSTKSKDNRYVILVEEKDEVVAIEIRGYIDVEKLMKCESITYNQ